MRIISHRGVWRTPDERNTMVAFERSVALGFGTESDVRDLDGQLVISHDPPSRDALPFSDFLSAFSGLDEPLAINVKADGLARMVAEAVRASGVSDPFVFDMSVPDLRSYLAAGIPVFSRLSEVEPFPVYADRIQGVWLDAFEHEWWTAETIEALLARGLRVCIVSPDLHGRPPELVWAVVRPLADREGLILCTDRPEDAAGAIGVKP